MPEPMYLTQEGAEKVRAELEQLKGPARLEISQRLRSAIQMGDLSENADYHKAKEDQGFLEGRILELEYILKNAIVVDENQIPKGIVSVGSHVTVQEEDFPPETYQLVGAKEADPRNGRISNESPIGQALMGKKEGETAIAQTPNGEVRMKVIKIE